MKIWIKTVFLRSSFILQVRLKCCRLMMAEIQWRDMAMNPDSVICTYEWKLWWLNFGILHIDIFSPQYYNSFENIYFKLWKRSFSFLFWSFTDIMKFVLLFSNVRVLTVLYINLSIFKDSWFKTNSSIRLVQFGTVIIQKIHISFEYIHFKYKNFVA